LSKAGTTVDRLNEVLSLTTSPRSTRDAAQHPDRDRQLRQAGQGDPGDAGWPPRGRRRFQKTFDKLNRASDDPTIAPRARPQDAETRKGAGRQGSGRAAQGRRRGSPGVCNIEGAACQLKLLADSRKPIRDFSQTGLNELSSAIREIRELTANLNIIASKLERDPAGFVFSGKHGYKPK
jgi:phospholipid/cholesterol/gamma-HCH transport system substrate-binding protein